MTTVRRNSREAKEFWSRATSARSYTLGNGFIGQPVEVDGVHDYYRRAVERGIEPKITKSGSTYTRHHHSNHWTEIETATGAARRKPDMLRTKSRAARRRGER